jgi:hydrogenase maturation protein HypF
VESLRQRKHREEKPFAVMFRSMEAVRGTCEVSRLEERLLQSPEAPIVLLRRLRPLNSSAVSAAVAPGNPNLGVLLPYTPLHHLLMASVGIPVVATSGNLSDEPICTDEHEAVDRLKGIADLFLVHNRPIARHVDDSIVREMAGRESVLRRARGYAPLPIRVQSVEGGVGNENIGLSNENSARCTPHSALHTVLAVGAHLKNSVALAVGPQVFYKPTHRRSGNGAGT